MSEHENGAATAEQSAVELATVVSHEPAPGASPLLRASFLRLPPDAPPPTIPRVPRRSATIVKNESGTKTLWIDPDGSGCSQAVNFVYVDTTGDGLTDALVADTDHDGFGDSLVVSTVVTAKSWPFYRSRSLAT